MTGEDCCYTSVENLFFHQVEFSREFLSSKTISPSKAKTETGKIDVFANIRSREKQH